MRSELWDIELDASYVASGHMPKTAAEVANDFSLEFRRANGDPQMPLDVKKRDLSQLTVDRQGRQVMAKILCIHEFDIDTEPILVPQVSIEPAA